MVLSLLMALALAPVTAAPPPAPPERRLVLANTYALGFGVLYPVPSGEVGVLLGSTLRPRRRRAGGEWRTALGYQLTLSVGFADLAFAESPANHSLSGVLFHRHGLVAMGLGGRGGRLFYGYGGAVVFGDAAPIGVEGEGRLGWRFTRDAAARVQGVLGGQLRLGAPFGGPPLPQLGVFIGFLVL